jgi:TPP-dependent pyruvate/acetoin dehydrogenase alpha subunit
MRSPTYNVRSNIAKEFPPEVSLGMFERMCGVRYFERGIIDAVAKKEINIYVYLSSGQEAVAAAIAPEVRDSMVFSQHRCHDMFLSLGGDPARLRDELLGLPTGTSQGKAGSNCLQWYENGITMFGHHGLIGENVPQAVGAALGSGRQTVCVFGDGSAEEDYVLSAIGFAVTHKLPVFFVCMDNDLSILTSVKTRRSWKITDVAEGFGMPAVDVADDPWAVLHYTRELKKNLPALINCRVCRGYWHVGIGIDNEPEWDRYELVKKELLDMGQGDAVREIEERARRSMEKIWDRELLLKPLKK